MVKNKIKKGTLMIYVDEFGNQKAVSPDELLVTVGKDKMTLTEILNNVVDEIADLKFQGTKLKEEFYNFKSKQLSNTADILENQSVHNKKIEALSNDVKALLSINKKN